MTTATDPRLSAALTHWGPRLIANGIDYSLPYAYRSLMAGWLAERLRSAR